MHNLNYVFTVGVHKLYTGRKKRNPNEIIDGI